MSVRPTFPSPDLSPQEKPRQTSSLYMKIHFALIFHHTSVLKHVSVMLTKVVIHRPLIIYSSISVENKRHILRNHYQVILKIFIHVGIDDLYITEQEPFIKSDLYIYII